MVGWRITYCGLAIGSWSMKRAWAIRGECLPSTRVSTYSSPMRRRCMERRAIPGDASVVGPDVDAAGLYLRLARGRVHNVAIVVERTDAAARE